MNAAVLKSPSAAAGVRPADRLGFTLFIAAILHVAFILGVGFSMPAPSQISKTLEITLATFKSDKAPEKADYLAQMNQQGSGTLPRIHRLSAASTMRDKGAWYKEDWRKKIERIGNLNYPDEARRQKLYGSLRLLVSINRDGTIYEVQVLESSGEPILDQAAQRIVRLAAPYAPFSGDLADIDRLEIIRTWRFERGDRLSSK